MAYPQINGFVSMLHVGISDKLDEWVYIILYPRFIGYVKRQKYTRSSLIHRLMHQICYIMCNKWLISCYTLW